MAESLDTSDVAVCALLLLVVASFALRYERLQVLIRLIVMFMMMMVDMGDSTFVWMSQILEHI